MVAVAVALVVAAVVVEGGRQRGGTFSSCRK